MQKNTIISIIISVVIIVGSLYFATKDTSISPGTSEVAQAQNSEIKNGVQYVTVTAKGGYSPKMSFIQPNIPTKLIVKTDGTYDCSASLIVRSVGFQKILQSTGEEVIDLGTPKSGEKIQGVCGMGMYSFQIKVN